MATGASLSLPDTKIGGHDSIAIRKPVPSETKA